MDKKPLPVLRATDETRRALKMIAAMTGETMQAALQRIVQAELERLQHKESKKR
jgi:hypothetical protein